MAATAILDYEFTKFYWLTVTGGPRSITLQIFVKIGRSVAEIVRFFEFSKWPPPPFLIFEIVKFFGNFIGYCREGLDSSARQILSKSVVPLPLCKIWL